MQEKILKKFWHTAINT